MEVIPSKAHLHLLLSGVRFVNWPISPEVGICLTIFKGKFFPLFYSTSGFKAGSFPCVLGDVEWGLECREGGTLFMTHNYCLKQGHLGSWFCLVFSLPFGQLINALKETKKNCSAFFIIFGIKVS
jgi:hypothetical protein